MGVRSSGVPGNVRREVGQRAWQRATPDVRQGIGQVAGTVRSQASGFDVDMRRDLGLLRRRWIWWRSLTKACVSLAALLLAWLEAEYLALQSDSPALPWLGLTVMLTVVGIAMWLRWSLRRRRGLDDGAWSASVLLARGAAADAEALRSAWELAPAAQARPMIAALIGAAAPARAQLAASVEAGVRQQRGWGALALAAGATLLVVTISTRDERLARQVAPVAVANHGPMDVGALVDDLRLAIEPPAYARDAIPPSEENAEETTVLRGSTVRVSASPLPGHANLVVELRRGDTIERVLPVAEAAGRVAFALTVNEAVTYRFVEDDAGGRQVRERDARSLQVRLDAPPEAQLLAPKGEVEVRAGDSVVIEAAVSDDVGVGSADLVVSLPAGGLDRRPIAVSPGDRRVGVRESVEVDKLDLRAGEIASIWIEVQDTNGLDGPRRGRSEAVALRMFSAERYHARMLDRLGELAVAWTVALADRLEQDPQRPKTTLKQAMTARSEMVGHEAALMETVAEVRRALAEDVLLRPQTAADLEAIERTLRDRLAEEERGVSHVDAQAQELAERRELSRLGRLHGKVVDAVERAVLGIAAVAVAEHRNALVRDGRTLAALEAKLAEVLAKLRTNPDDAALRAEAERLLDAIAQQLEQMRAEASRQLQLVPPERINEGALEPTELQGALSERKDGLEAIRAALREGKIDDALAAFEASRSRLDAAMSNLQSEAEAERTAEDAALERLMGELQAGIDQARDGERGLREALRADAEDQDRATAEQLQRDLQNALPKLQALLDDARDQVRPKRLSSMEMRGSLAIADARSALSQAAAAVDAGDVDGALLALLEAADSLGAANAALMAPDTSPGDLARRARQADRERVAAASDRAARAAALLREVLPRPEELHDPATRRKIAGQAGEQEKVRRQLEKVRQRLAREAHRHPGLESQVGGRLDHAEQMMRQAGAAMSMSDASRAHKRMADAIAALDAAEQMMQRGGQSGGAPQPGGGGERVGWQPNSKPLPLPGKNGRNTDTPEDFRQRLQDAARREAPAGWAERVRRYWQRLDD